MYSKPAHRKSKGESAIPLLEHRRGAHLPFYDRWVRRWIDHWVRDAWPVWRQTYTVTSTAAERHRPLTTGTILYCLVNRGMCVGTTCPRLLPGSAPTRSRTCNLGISILARYSYTTETHSKVNKHVKWQSFFMESQFQSYGASPAMVSDSVICHSTQEVNAPRVNLSQTGQ